MDECDVCGDQHWLPLNNTEEELANCPTCNERGHQDVPNGWKRLEKRTTLCEREYWVITVDHNAEVYDVS